MRWTSSSRYGRSAGFGLLELVLALFVMLLLAAAAGPLWLSVEKMGVRAGDETIRTMPASVALARFERDVRLASSLGCPFHAGGALLEAGAKRIVLLTKAVGDENLRLVAWELTGSSLMRRWTKCPSALPASFPPSAFVDNKTMLQSLGPGSRFTYLVGGSPNVAPVPTSRLAFVDQVVLELQTGEGTPAAERACATAAVGR